MRVVQLSDPHLVSAPSGWVRQRPALQHWQLALGQAALHHPDLLLITGDCCQDESWNGYALLRDSLDLLPSKTRVAVLPGNHDHPQRLRAALGRRAEIAPEALRLGDWTVLILDSHWYSHEGGQIGKGQLRWLETQLQERNLTSGPLLVCLHHPPLPIGAPEWDRIGLDDGEQLMRLLQPVPQLRAVVFGHLHQHWQGSMPERNDVVLLACPSTLCAFPALQACPLGRSQLPGGRLLDLSSNGRLTHTLLRWPMPKRG